VGLVVTVGVYLLDQTSRHPIRKFGPDGFLNTLATAFWIGMGAEEFWGSLTCCTGLGQNLHNA